MPYPPRGRLSLRLLRFFSGRYGADTLYYFLFSLSLVCYVLAMVLRSLWLAALSSLLLFYALWRAMSRNIPRRQQENRRFLGFFRRLCRPFSLFGARIRYRKTHVFRRCPQCKNHLRLPRRAGKHTVRCPKCNNLFDVTIH